MMMTHSLITTNKTVTKKSLVLKTTTITSGCQIQPNHYSLPIQLQRKLQSRRIWPHFHWSSKLACPTPSATCPTTHQGWQLGLHLHHGPNMEELVERIETQYKRKSSACNTYHHHLHLLWFPLTPMIFQIFPSLMNIVSLFNIPSSKRARNQVHPSHNNKYAKTNWHSSTSPQHTEAIGKVQTLICSFFFGGWTPKGPVMEESYLPFRTYMQGLAPFAFTQISHKKAHWSQAIWQEQPWAMHWTLAAAGCFNEDCSGNHNPPSEIPSNCTSQQIPSWVRALIRWRRVCLAKGRHSHGNIWYKPQGRQSCPVW